MYIYVYICKKSIYIHVYQMELRQMLEAIVVYTCDERWGAGVETQKYVRGDIGGWGRVPFKETYAPSLSTIYDGA